jgi:hypothetical protein
MIYAALHLPGSAGTLLFLYGLSADRRSQRQGAAAVLPQPNPLSHIVGLNRPHVIFDCAIPRRPRQRNVTRPRINLLALGTPSAHHPRPPADPASGTPADTESVPPLQAQPVLSQLSVPPPTSCGNPQLQRSASAPPDAISAGRSSTKRKRTSDPAATDNCAAGVSADDTEATTRLAGRRPKKRPSRYIT